MSAGNDLNQSVALVAAANKVLQDPSQVGAALRTIALRIRGTSLKVLEEMGEETDGVIESVSKLQEKVKEDEAGKIFKFEVNIILAMHLMHIICEHPEK